jgi:hypothetical protein
MPRIRQTIMVKKSARNSTPMLSPMTNSDILIPRPERLTMPITIWAQQRARHQHNGLAACLQGDTMFRTLSLSVATLRTVPKYRTTEIR